MILTLAVLAVSWEVKGRPAEPPIFLGFPSAWYSEPKALRQNETSLRRTQLVSRHSIAPFWDLKMGGIVTKRQSGINTRAVITGVVAFTATGGEPIFYRY